VKSDDLDEKKLSPGNVSWDFRCAGFGLDAIAKSEDYLEVDSNEQGARIYCGSVALSIELVLFNDRRCG
jgi:hypothetical protein